ncbi:unnamed protein product [Timema podura]|uniref:PDEase domain-containing protein n=1 Tax=Timema podura TaxID=61482 RepID=A0ABN7PK47_TIMPD|nr:unnamed protein product [Timema podura]
MNLVPYQTIHRSYHKSNVILSTKERLAVDRLRTFSPQGRCFIYYFDVFSLDDFEKARHAIYMFKDLFGAIKFNNKSLIRFTLTVKKNYRRIPYHNWTHGFSVANSVFCIIKHSPNLFTTNEIGGVEDI